MIASEGWCKHFKDCYFHEKVLIASLLIIFTVLGFDCWFQNLPFSGYGIIFITLLFVACTSLAICHEVGTILSTDLQQGNNEKTEKWYLSLLRKKEQGILQRCFQTEVAALQYPTSLNEQMRLLLKDIERDYVKTWYSEISGNPSFLFDCHLVLEEVIFKLIAKLQACSWNYILKNTLFLYLSHLQEYKRALRRSVNVDLSNDAVEPKNGASIVKKYRYLHPGSQGEKALNYYLTKVIRILMEEFGSHDFANSLEYTILSSILARKVLKSLLFNIEDPTWIYLRILYGVNHECYVTLMKDCSYSIKEITTPDLYDEGVNKFRMKPAVTHSTDLGSNIFDRTLSSKVFTSGNSGPQKKDRLSLPIPTGKPDTNISSVLGNLISSTAAPLLPDNVSLCYQPLNKMWLSPVAEIKQEIADSVVSPFLKTITEGFKSDENTENEQKETVFFTNKVLTRSKSSDAMTPEEETSTMPRRDISVGEELCEGVFLPDEGNKRLVKTKSFDAGSSGDLPGDETLKGDVSPVYEEPEDFATTIAKLRSVLQQRESTSTLSDKSSNSIESQGTFSKENTFDSIEKSVPVDGERFSPDSQIACDIPSDGRPFVNVCIPKTEVHESGGSPYVLYTIQYDGIFVKEHGGNDNTKLVLQTAVVKRRFQEFLNLQTRLEENPSLKSHLKGIKGPSKWLNLPFTGKTDDSTTASRRPVLETYLQQLCGKLEVATCPALQEFLAYGSNAVTAFASKENNSSIQKIDKFLSNKVTGVFNSIKTVLPSFDGNSTNAVVQDAKEVKSSLEQNLLQGFLNFGNKADDVPELVLDCKISEASGDALTDSIRQFLSEKSDCIEDALDVLDNSNWHSEAGECHVLNGQNCVWRGFKDAVIDDDLDKFDSRAPVVNLVIEIMCELLDSSGGWVTKDPIVQILKSLAAHWETEFQEHLGKLDWDRICGNLVRLLRVTIFSQQAGEEGNFDCEQVKFELSNLLLNIFPTTVADMCPLSRGEHDVSGVGTTPIIRWLCPEKDRFCPEKGRFLDGNLEFMSSRQSHLMMGVVPTPETSCSPLDNGHMSATVAINNEELRPNISPLLGNVLSQLTLQFLLISHCH